MKRNRFLPRGLNAVVKDVEELIPTATLHTFAKCSNIDSKSMMIALLLHWSKINC